MELDAEIARKEAEVAALRARALSAAHAGLAQKERELRGLQEEASRLLRQKGFMHVGVDWRRRSCQSRKQAIGLSWRPALNLTILTQLHAIVTGI